MTQVTNYSISTDTQTAASGLTRFTDRTDTEVAPPFEALDRLSNVGQRIDAALSELIGRLTPYCTQNYPVAEKLNEVRAELPSGLEQRIDREIDLLMEMALRAEELIGRLRL